MTEIVNKIKGFLRGFILKRGLELLRVSARREYTGQDQVWCHGAKACPQEVP